MHEHTEEQIVRTKDFGVLEVRYDRDSVTKKCLWAIDYWLKKREPIPTKNPAKCRACEYRPVCNFSLAKG
jgi:CRISPR/Cas system-associated exonuclease Cas4 (RecB family)